MVTKTAKAIVFFGFCALALGMMSPQFAKSNQLTPKNHLSESSQKKLSLVSTCKCGHKNVNLIGECADPSCTYYYGALDW